MKENETKRIRYSFNSFNIMDINDDYNSYSLWGIIKMKQTDKCECGHEKDLHGKMNPYSSACWKMGCKCIKFKSHSQELMSPKLSNVRASGEEKTRVNGNEVIHNKSSKDNSHYDVNVLGTKTGHTSPMPYTPLTKDKTVFENMQLYPEEDVLSALNGLKYIDKLALDKFMDRIWDSRIYLNKRKVQEEFRDLREQLIQNKLDMFQIIDELKKE